MRRDEKRRRRRLGVKKETLLRLDPLSDQALRAVAGGTGSTASTYVTGASASGSANCSVDLP
jgi:hypothetical protein